jgi:hypothetical protein
MGKGEGHVQSVVGHVRQTALSIFTMNSLYTLGVRQTNSLQTDLERLKNGDNSPSLLGIVHAQLKVRLHH